MDIIKYSVADCCLVLLVVTISMLPAIINSDKLMVAYVCYANTLLLHVCNYTCT